MSTPICELPNFNVEMQRGNANVAAASVNCHRLVSTYESTSASTHTYEIN